MLVNHKPDLQRNMTLPVYRSLNFTLISVTNGFPSITDENRYRHSCIYNNCVLIIHWCAIAVESKWRNMTVSLTNIKSFRMLQLATFCTETLCITIWNTLYHTVYCIKFRCVFIYISCIYFDAKPTREYFIFANNRTVDRDTNN